MKKLYTLFMAAGVSALACQAAQPASAVTDYYPATVSTAASKVINKSFESISTSPVSEVRSRSITPPADLSTTNYVMTYEIVERDQASGQDKYFPFTSELTFTKVAPDETATELGLDKYEMAGWVAGVYKGLEIFPQEVYYEPSEGMLMIPTPQDMCRGVLNNGKTATGITWNSRNNGYVYTGVEFLFEFNGDGFDWINVTNVRDQDTGQTEEFVSDGLFVASLDENNDLEALFFRATNFEIRNPQGTMYITYDGRDPDTGAENTENTTGSIFATVSGNTVTLDNFGTPIAEWVVPFTVDTEAKTFTCENVQVATTDAGVPVYLSQANNLFNKFEEQSAYKVEAPYTCEGGKTTVNIGEWNAFYYNPATKEDENIFVKIYNTSIVFNFNIETVIAGVGNIAVDADENAPVEYFNLQGVRVQNPENGLYIRRQGKSVSKVIL